MGSACSEVSGARSAHPVHEADRRSIANRGLSILFASKACSSDTRIGRTRGGSGPSWRPLVQRHTAARSCRLDSPGPVSSGLRARPPIETGLPVRTYPGPSETDLEEFMRELPDGVRRPKILRCLSDGCTYH